MSPVQQSNDEAQIPNRSEQLPPLDVVTEVPLVPEVPDVPEVTDVPDELVPGSESPPASGIGELGSPQKPLRQMKPVAHSMSAVHGTESFVSHAVPTTTAKATDDAARIDA